MSLYCLLSCVNIRKLSTVVTSVPADLLSACRLGGHHEPCAVLVLAIKISFFKITFSLLIYLTFAFSVLMQTKSSWKAARVSPRSLSTITMFLAGRVGTWAVFVRLGYFIYLLDFSVPRLNGSFPDFVTSGRLYVCMRGVGGITLLLQNNHSCLAWTHKLLESKQGPSCWGLWFSLKNLDRPRGISCHGWVWWGQYSLNRHPHCHACVHACWTQGCSWGSYPGWLRSTSSPHYPWVQESGVSKFLLPERVSTGVCN